MTHNHLEAIPEELDLADKFLCCDCVGEEYFKAAIVRAANIQRCSYCTRSRESMLISEAAARIDSVFRNHFRRTPREPEYRYEEWEREGERTVDAFQIAADIPEAAAQDIQTILSETHYNMDDAAMGEEGEYDADAQYEEANIDDRKWQERWMTYRRSLQTQSRFFNSSGRDLLQSVFAGVDNLSSVQGKSMFVDVGPGHQLNHLYRARAFQSPSALMHCLERPDIGIGPPPYRNATGGRMNAPGISVFYGATEEETAFAAHPERFKGLAPQAAKVPESVWINPPIKENATPTIIVSSPLNT